MDTDRIPPPVSFAFSKYALSRVIDATTVYAVDYSRSVPVLPLRVLRCCVTLEESFSRVNV